MSLPVEQFSSRPPGSQRVQRQKRLTWQTRWGNAATPYMLLLPAVTLVIGFRYLPTASAIYHSFTHWDGLNPAVFVGLRNYRALWQDHIFHAALRNFAAYTMLRVLVVTGMALLGAELISNLRSRRVQLVWKVFFVLPMAVPWIVTILLWKFIYQPQFGLLNQALRGVGLGVLAQPWLGQSQTALPALVLVGFPFLATIQMLVLSAALQQIPDSVRDATRLDGASTLRRVISIDLPLIRGPLALCVLLEALSCLQRIDLFLILTDGGPGYATEVPGLYMYRSAFTYGQFGYATAIGTMMLIGSLLFSILFVRLRWKVFSHEQ